MEFLAKAKQFLILFICIFLAGQTLAQSNASSSAPPLLPPDDRYKADALVIVAHPDDDVLIGGYLARIVLDEHKRVAVIYCTSGDGGGNSVGNEAGAALGQLRVIEARRALSSLGIENVWFLPGHDTPGQNVLYSLDHWNHGQFLDEIVRLVRITRPEVILTWLPDPVAGEDHEDHQAAGVLATEAFDLAADPTTFPEQVSPSRDRVGMNNLTEGLLPWQPKKLYFFTDAFENFSPYWHDPAEFPSYRKTIVDGTGPTYDTTTISPSRHVSYAQLEAQQQAFYLTQEGALGVDAIGSKNYKAFEDPIHLIFGKSVASSTSASITDDVFAGISTYAAPFARTTGYEPQRPKPFTFEIGDPWHFYSLFWKAHNLDRLAGLIPEPELASRFADTLHIPLLACNHTAEAASFTLTTSLPAGWADQTQFNTYAVKPGECYPILEQVTSSTTSAKGWQQAAWSASVNGHAAGAVHLHVYLGTSGGLPQ